MKIGVLCSGGDAPGMNAALRAVVLTAAEWGAQVEGILFGFDGLIDNQTAPLLPEAVSGLARHGGAFIGSARSPRFLEKDFRQQAAEHCRRKGLEALVVIGGDGSYRGAAVFEEETGIPCVGLPGTIDNDLEGTEYTIGFQTAVQTALEAVDKVMDTAESHGRVFVVEVMGRDAGHIAANTAAAAGAHAVLIPEVPHQVPALLESFKRYQGAMRRRPIIIIYSEGESEVGREDLVRNLRTSFPQLDVRSLVLGHLQRGGPPVAADRILAARLGRNAVLALSRGLSGMGLGIRQGQLVHTPLAQCKKRQLPPESYLLELGSLGLHEWKS